MENSQTDNIFSLEKKYIMFLTARYFRSSFFRNIYKKLRKNLENLGITLICIDDFINYYNQGKSSILFDDKNIPSINQLYIHMFKNLYYSDSIYNKKKMEKEREHLFLLAGKLGVNEITYETDILETIVTNTNIGTTVSNAVGTIVYTKTIDKKQGISGHELYENRGASLYVNSKNKEDVDNGIKESMDFKNSEIFSYEFYKQSPKLEAFVYKRYEFKMSEVEYIIESEDIFDLSLAVKAQFVEYGLSVSFDKNIISNEKVQYKLKFFPDNVLVEECAKRNYEYERGKSDPFYSIRKCYDNWNNQNDKKSITYEIYDYVYMICKQSYGKIYDESNNKKIYYFSLEELIRFILKTQPEVKDEWDEFTHTAEIKDWIEEFLYENFYTKLDNYDNESDDKIISEFLSRYPIIDIKKINCKISWFNINWTDSEENIKENIKNELNNDCEQITISTSNMDFIVLIGDNSMHRNIKQDNMYVKVKRNFNQVSRLAATRMVVEEPDKNYQYKIIEIENDRNRILAKCQDYELKINSLEENYLALEREYERIRTIYANNKLCLKDRDWEIAQLTKQVTALETELANKTNYEIKYLELKSTIEKLELEFNVEKNKKITLEQTDGKNIQNELHSEC
jgi:hypothetical protein